MVGSATRWREREREREGWSEDCPFASARESWGETGVTGEGGESRRRSWN